MKFLDFLGQSTRKDDDVKVDTSHDYLNFLPRASRTEFIEDIPNLKPEHAYRIDSRPDPNNLAFSSLHRYARYSLKDAVRLDKNPFESDSKKVATKIPRRYFSFKKLHNPSPIFVFANSSLGQSEDFIKLVSTDLKETEPTNQGIKFKSLSGGDEEARVGPSQVPNQVELAHELVQTFNSILNQSKRTADEIWIDFVCCQDLIAQNGEKNDDPNKKNDDQKAQPKPPSGSSNQMRKYFLEKKLSILEKALNQNRRSINLNLLQLSLIGGNYTDLGLSVTEVDSKWKQLAFLFPFELRVWQEWATFTLRCRSIIDYASQARTGKTFRSALQSFCGKFLEGNLVQVHQMTNGQVHRVCVDLVLALTRFYDSIDQREKAVAIWQALFEFNCRTPGRLREKGNSFVVSTLKCLMWNLTKIENSS